MSTIGHFEAPAVWVVQDNDYNLSTAQEYGVIRFITEDDFQCPGDRHETQVKRDVNDFIIEYVPGHDCILLVGNPMVIGFVMANLSGWVRDGKAVGHRFLKWDKKLHKYLEYTLIL